ncbi:MAG: shikimate kinase [Streptococcaceae bacterium]|jgi:shikimate kinase|nr:shikimate kinase [Streptococcaceae bacterium]
MTTFLIGFMGSGKSTIAKLLADDFIDMDAEIVSRIGMPIADYFAKFGEASFRQIESQVLRELVATGGVIATGGGVVISEDNRQILRESAANIVYLEAAFDQLYARLMADQVNLRPVFINKSRHDLEQIFEGRKPFYEEVATQTVTVTDRSPEAIAKEIRL